MSISKQIPDSIKRVSRCFGYALWLHDTNSWFGLGAVLRAHLADDQRRAIAFIALRSLSDNDAAQVIGGALSKGVGSPIAPLFNHMDESAFWADMAEPEELEAYCLASFNAMPRLRQAAFLDFVQGRKAA